MTIDSPSILYVFSSGWAQRQRDVAAGRAPGEAYGFHALQARGLDVRGVDADVVPGEPMRLADDALQRLYVIPRSGMGYRLAQALGVCRAVAGDPDRWIVATSDSIGLPLLRLRRAGRLHNRVALISIGLADRLQRGTIAAPLLGRYRALVREADAVLAFTPPETATLGEWAGVDVAILPLGVDVAWWRAPEHAPQMEHDVFSGGRDPARDFVTLDAAVAALPGTRTVVVGRLAGEQGIRPRPGLEVLQDVSFERFRACLWGARVVVVPSRRAAYGAGQSTVLHAMAAGRPVVMTDTGWGRHHGLRAGEHFVEVAPADPAALRAAVAALLADPDRAAAIGARGAQAARSSFSSDAQADALLRALGADAR
jgi:hypothetical protein